MSKQVFSTLLLALSLCACLSPAYCEAAPKRYLSYGDYMSSGARKMVPALMSAMDPDAPPMMALSLGVGAHGGFIHIWESGAGAWITGDGEIATTNWKDNKRNRQTAVDFVGIKPQLVVIQADFGNPKVDKEAFDKAMLDYLALAKKANATLVFCAIPGRQHLTTIKANKKSGTMRPRVEADYTEELARQRKAILHYAHKHGALIAPTPLAYAHLRKDNRGMDIHAPVPGSDTHTSVLDNYLMACAVAFSTVKEMPTAFPDNAKVFADADRARARKNKKMKGGEPLPLPSQSITAEQRQAIHQAVWAAITEIRSAKAP